MMSNSSLEPELKLFVSTSASSTALYAVFSYFMGARGGNNHFLTGRRLFWPSSMDQTLSLPLELLASCTTFLFLWCLLHWVRVMGFSHVILEDIRVFLWDLRGVSIWGADVNVHNFPFASTSFWLPSRAYPFSGRRICSRNIIHTL